LQEFRFYKEGGYEETVAGRDSDRESDDSDDDFDNDARL
jgi:hypothetical protein